jgi:Na+-transporting NADH:ubiquinone oxidoreductase subunit NqrA
MLSNRPLQRCRRIVETNLTFYVSYQRRLTIGSLLLRAHVWGTSTVYQSQSLTLTIWAVGYILRRNI